ncbi:Hypothetical_protein [Hexamita inflata]|uniref:Hypothetical_protein n=1 Tax=Hexamita inflata TaxID=28002 RepID=A0AA86UMS0_9EUKA|nr:Hypothetical protein HINF_LOCUS52110 [Hexamita inflata]
MICNRFSEIKQSSGLLVKIYQFINQEFISKIEDDNIEQLQRQQLKQKYETQREILRQLNEVYTIKAEIQQKQSQNSENIYDFAQLDQQFELDCISDSTVQIIQLNEKENILIQELKKIQQQAK